MEQRRYRYHPFFADIVVSVIQAALAGFLVSLIWAPLILVGFVVFPFVLIDRRTNRHKE